MTTLVMGPVLFNWAPAAWRDFYFRIADEGEVDTVCIGEVVCSKREPFFAPHLPAVVERLKGAGKQVIRSTLALNMNRREIEGLATIVRGDPLLNDADMMVEANDISAAALLRGRPHAIGPYVNVYNEGTLDYLRRNGAETVCLPVELGFDALASLAGTDPNGLEVLIFGRLPLAISARCYHARACDLHKDNCQFVCAEDANGMAVDTLDGAPFLAVNGVQTLSHAYAELSASVPRLIDIGIRRLRLSPQAGIDMVSVAAVYRELADGGSDPAEAASRLGEIANSAVDPVAFCNGYITGDSGCALHPAGATAHSARAFN